MCTITLCENVVDQFGGKLTAGSSRCSSSVLPVAAYNRPIKMITQKRLQKLRRNAQQLKRPKLGSELMKLIEPKYFDTLSLANSIGSGGTIFGLSLIPQGATQSERVGDFAQPLRLILNYSLYVVNSDIVTTVRLIFFRWHIHSAFGPPNIVNLLEAPASSNVLSHLNFQYQNDFDILWDRQFQASGITTAPTVNSNFGATGLNIPLGAHQEIEFALGATTATDHLYLLAVSDSALTPFPILNFCTRLYYGDTVHQKIRKLIK